jgi:hypothetical protein
MTTERQFQLKSLSNKLRHFTLYETDQRYYLVGSDVSKKQYKLLKIEKMGNSFESLQITEDVGVYTCSQMNDLLAMIKSANPKVTTDNTNIGFVTRVQIAYGIVGFIKFTHGYYMILITDKRQVGTIAGHFVYECAGTALIPLFKTTNTPKLFAKLRSRDDEQRYKEIFTELDLSKDFYFSYTYDLANTLQHNMMDSEHEDHKSMFEWNSFLLKPLFEQVSDRMWMLPIIHGYFAQTQISVFGKLVNIVLVGRRSRYFAGTRYLKRGISDSGHVANHVETEQIVYDTDSLTNRQSQGGFSSLVQTRGSIPLYWSQTISTKVVDTKPDIVLGKFDPLYFSTEKHFDYLMNRHSFPVICLDLVKNKEKKPREQILGTAYRNCVDYLNQKLPGGKKLKYISWDFRRSTKDKPEKALNELAAFAEENLEQTGFFCSNSNIHSEGHSLQKGVLRTNCIDCLDRTNIVQFFIGKYALGQQLHALGITDSPHLVYYSNVVRILMELYDAMGDKIALQYGGSRTVSAGINHRGYSWDFVTSLKRYYSNNFKDERKQHAMNLFLGNFVPNSQGRMPAIWALDTDSYLHDNDRSDAIETANHESTDLTEEERMNKFFEGVYHSSSVTDFSQFTSHFNNTVDLFAPSSKKKKRDSIVTTPTIIESASPVASPKASPRNKDSEDREFYNNSNSSTPSDTYEQIQQMIDSTSDHIFPDIETQGEILRRFEGKMESQSIIDPNSFYDENFIRKHRIDMVRYQEDTEYLSKLFIHDKKDGEMYRQYAEDCHPKALDRKDRSQLQQEDDNESNTKLLSQKSLDNRATYEDYLKKFAQNHKNVVRSEILAKDYAVYQKYTTLSAPFSDIEKTQEQYQQLILNEKKPDTIQQQQQQSSTILTYPQPHIDRLYSYFASVNNDPKELSIRIVKLMFTMREDMIIVDRVRHPKPAKKLFAQISLFELLKGRLYRKCFLGCRAIDWVLSHSGQEAFIEKKINSREEAKDFLQILLECHVFHHVAFAKVFLDGHYLYKFSMDDPTRVLNMQCLQTNESRHAVTVSLDALYKITEVYRIIFNSQNKSTDVKMKVFYERLAEQSKVCKLLLSQSN